MTVQKNNIKPILGMLLIVLVAMIRLGVNASTQFHALSSFSPVGAMAILGGACFSSKRWSYTFPLLTLFVSDIILSLTIYRSAYSGILYSGWYWVYGAFVLMTMASRWLMQKITAGSIILASLLITGIHWIVTDLGVWTGSHTYPQTAAGFWSCLLAAIPFEKNFLAATILYSGLCLAGFEWLRRQSFVKGELV
jgi:hypothetical protein